MILGGLDPCPDGLGHFFGDEVPQSARLSAGGDAKAIWEMPKCLQRQFEWSFPLRKVRVLAKYCLNMPLMYLGLHLKKFPLNSFTIIKGKGQKKTFY